MMMMKCNLFLTLLGLFFRPSLQAQQPEAIKTSEKPIKESISLVVVFKKNISQKNTLQIMEGTGHYFIEGADNSKGRAYYYKTGERYHIVFEDEVQKNAFRQKYQSHKAIYEIYEPDWDLIKD